MEVSSLDETDAMAAQNSDQKGWPPATLEPEKKTLFWMGGVMDCFSGVFSLFSKADLSPTKEDDWEVPYASLSEFLYLGSGAQGIVFRGLLNGELVAVKKLKERSEANIKHLRKLNHENIVRFRGVSIDGPIPCIIMEFCQYGPLFNFLHSGVYISPTQTFQWAKDIAIGMSYLHSNNIIHRDLKSPNILIADNLIVKVSDFGTAREWDNVSAIMSFTGTVAWMAPEVIRHEPCSERVDVWSYGVVLWELLTKEIPYRNMESHAIMWGVGTDTISLPIPPSCPGSLRTLLEHCWSRTPRNRPSFHLIAICLDAFKEEMVLYPSFSVSRPPFKIIAANLEVAGEQFTQSQGTCFSAAQITWRNEIKEMKFVARSSPSEGQLNDPALRRQRELELAREFRIIYEQQLCRANEIYLEVCTVRLQLEQREQAVSEREKALDNACHCGVRKAVKCILNPASTSSDNIENAKKERRRKKKEQQAQVVVNFIDKGQKTVSVAVSPDNVQHVMKDVSASASDTVDNNNTPAPPKKNSPVEKKNTSIKFKDVVVEQNGNVVKAKEGRKKKNVNANYIPDIAHV